MRAPIIQNKMDHFKAILKPWTLPADSAISVPRGEKKNFILAEMWSPIEISALFKRVTIGGWIVNDKKFMEREFISQILFRLPGYDSTVL